MSSSTIVTSMQAFVSQYNADKNAIMRDPMLSQQARTDKLNKLFSDRLDTAVTLVRSLWGDIEQSQDASQGMWIPSESGTAWGDLNQLDTRIAAAIQRNERAMLDPAWALVELARWESIVNNAILDDTSISGKNRITAIIAAYDNTSEQSRRAMQAYSGKLLVNFTDGQARAFRKRVQAEWEAGLNAGDVATLRGQLDELIFTLEKGYRLTREIANMFGGDFSGRSGYLSRVIQGVRVTRQIVDPATLSERVTVQRVAWGPVFHGERGTIVSGGPTFPRNN